MTQALIVTNSFRIIFVLVCVVAAIAAVTRRRQLGGAGELAVLGFGALAAAEALGVGVYMWEVLAVARHQPAQKVLSAVWLSSYATPALASIGAVFVALAVFVRRPAGH